MLLKDFFDRESSCLMITVLRYQSKSAPLQRKLSVDKNTLSLHNVVAMTANTEAIGHGIMTDMKSLRMLAALGNSPARPHGSVPVRAGHPGLSENAFAKTLGDASKFRVVGEQLLTNITLMDQARKSPAFSQDPIEWVLGMAESRPDRIMMSAVVYSTYVWVLEDGKEVDSEAVNERPDEATNPLPIMRPVDFAYLDFVNEGALTTSLFETQANGPLAAAAYNIYARGENHYLAEIFAALDTIGMKYKLSEDDLRKKSQYVIEAYISQRNQTKWQQNQPQVSVPRRKRTVYHLELMKKT